MRGTLLVSCVLAVAGCKKQDRCEEIYAQWQRIVEELNRFAGETGAGGGDGAATADDKPEFMAMCRKLPADQRDCLRFEKMLDEDCAEVLEKAEAEANAAAPAKVIEWETVKLADGRVTAKVPKGWDHEELMGDRYTPPVEADLGVFTTYAIDVGCAEGCEPRSAAAWAALVEDELAAGRDPDETIVRDEPMGDHGRVQVSWWPIGRRKVHAVTVMLWRDGGDRYVTCEVELDARLEKNLPDFEAACRAIVLE